MWTIRSPANGRRNVAEISNLEAKVKRLRRNTIRYLFSTILFHVTHPMFYTIFYYLLSSDFPLLTRSAAKCQSANIHHRGEFYARESRD